MGDEAAGAWFKGDSRALRKDPRWTVERRSGRALVEVTDPGQAGAEFSRYEVLF